MNYRGINSSMILKIPKMPLLVFSTYSSKGIKTFLGKRERLEKCFISFSQKLFSKLANLLYVHNS